MKQLDDVKISHKLIASYAVIIALVIFLSVFSFFSMNRLGGMFTEYRSIARETLLLADMSQHLGDARRNVFRYRILGAPEIVDQVHNDLGKLAEYKAQIKEVVTDESYQEVLNKLDMQAKEYKAAFAQSVEKQKIQNEAMLRLNKAGTSTRKIITSIIDGANRVNASRALYHAGTTQQHLLLARYYAEQYLFINNAKDADRVAVEIKKAQEEQRKMLLSLSEASLRSDALKVGQGLKAYANDFQAARAAIEAKAQFYAEMDRLGPIMLNKYIDMFKEYEAQQNTLGPIAAAKISRVSVTSVIAAIIITLLASCVAIFMAKLIATALLNVTKVMQRLRKGDFTVNVDGMERGDEIGEMARSIAKFKEDAEESFLLKQMVDDMPTNVMTVDVRDDLKVNYINNTSVKTLTQLEEYLPIKANEILGRSIDIFHKDPSHQRQMLANPQNLPHRAKIGIGPEKMQLLVSAIHDKKGDYVGAMLTWDIITAKETMGENVENVVGILSSAVTELEATAQNMSSMAERTQGQATSVAAAAEQASTNVSSVSSSTEELTASISEISKQIQESTKLTSDAKNQADMTNGTVGQLKNAAQKIGDVVNLINDISEQTNLLALNATIEAARAGDAGKGFAVVASEVKNLANETGKATEEITAQISEMQGVTENAVISIEGISKTITELNALASAIAASVEEQSAATGEIARSVEQASMGTQEVTQNITTVSQAAQETGGSAQEVLMTAKELGKQSESLKGHVNDFFAE